MVFSFIKAGKKPSKTPHKGLSYEQAAYKWLSNQGLRLITNNYHCRGGEIDLIMEDSDTLVFFEIRYRRQPNHGNAIETVDWRKQQKICLTAEHYLSSHPAYQNKPTRIDVVGVYPDQTNAMMCGHREGLRFEWIKNAIMPF